MQIEKTASGRVTTGVRCYITTLEPISPDVNMYDFGGDCAQTYTERCNKCGRAIELSTQQDGHPEYRTDVYVRCVCGESVGFNLPVN